MLHRQQLPVASPIPLSGLVRAATSLLSWSGARATAARNTDVIAQRYGASAVALTDSGTSALVAALRLALPKGGTVAYPAYACVDLIAAARHANVAVRLYDVDPNTLSPDLDSVRTVLREGIEAIVVAHLYGFPADIPAVREAAAEFGTVIIEDAAQHAGATIHGTLTGRFGDLTVLSFGRGKGMTAGNGGALLAVDPRWRSAVDTLSTALPSASRGTGTVVGATASWLLGRPSIYAVPAGIPALHLGETVYHDAHDPAPLTRAAQTLLSVTLRDADATIGRRQKNAAVLNDLVRSSRARPMQSIAGGVPGYLRFPVRLPDGVPAAPRLGIVRGYPRPLAEQPELALSLCPVNGPLTGARELARSLFTLPTHHLVTSADLARLGAWLRTL